MKSKLTLSIFIILSIIATGCSNIQSLENDSIKQTDNDIKPQIENLQEKVDFLEKQLDEINYHEDLLDLTTYQSVIFDKFRKSYDVEVLKGLEPISICKMYLYAQLIGDYETQYEFILQNDDFLMTKEEFLDIFIEEKTNDFAMFKGICDLKVDISTDDYNKEHAVISWKLKNDCIDDKQGASLYGFSMQKDEEIWKVCFLPLQ